MSRFRENPNRRNERDEARTTKAATCHLIKAALVRPGAQGGNYESLQNDRRFCGLALGSLLVGWATPSSAANEPLKVAWILGGPISDVGWNAAHHRGIVAVQKAFPGKVEVTYKESVPAGPQTAQVIDSLVQAGNKIIFTATIGFARYAEAAAQKYPDVKFIQFEGATIRTNLAAFNANFPDGFYILGMAAGAASKSGAIGMVGAFSSPSNVRALNELLMGARRFNPNATVQVVFINSWFDPPKETQAAQSLLASRADVLGMMMNSPSTGQVAENAKIAFLGRDSDQRAYAPNSYLAGAILNWDLFYISEVKAVLMAPGKPGIRCWSSKMGQLKSSLARPSRS